MKKIILSLMTIISFIFAVGITEAFAETYEDFEYVVEDGEVIIINFKSDDTTVTVPDEIDNLPVTTIDSGAFASETKIKKITLPDTITTIGYHAFNYCTALESINIPSSVTTIEDAAFGSCNSLSKVYITDMEAWCNIDFEGYSANPFYKGTAALYLNNRFTSSITIPEGVTQLKPYAFYGFNEMTSIKIPVSLVSVGKDAFKNCTGITKVTISDIGAWCNIDFYNKYATPLWNGSKLYKGSSELKTLTIPDGVTQIKSYAFFGCTSITKVSIPESVTLLGTDTFGKCINLAEAVISAPLTEIPSHTFYECTALEDVNIPETVQVIGNTCFYNCSSLESITIPKSVKNFNSSAFSHCDNLSKVYIEDLAAWCNIDISGKNSHPFQNFGTIYLNNKILKDVVVPEGITQIKNFAFYNCNTIITVTLHDGVTSIGEYAFSGCIDLKTTYYHGTQEQYEAMSVAAGNSILTNNVVFVKHIRAFVSDDKKTITVSMPSCVNKNDAVMLALYNGEEFIGIQIKKFEGTDITFNPEASYTDARIMVWNTQSLLPSCNDKNI